jgi:signal transduction histidine kinase
MSQDGIFSAICNAGGSLPGIVMGWIGLATDGDPTLRPVALWGDDTGYLSKIRVTTDDADTARGPAGRAFLSGRPSVLAIDDPDFAPWRDEAHRRGYRSIAGIPLRQPDGMISGVLVLYSDQDEFFTEYRVALLSAFGEAAGIAIENARLHERHTRHADDLEEAIRARTEELNRKNEALELANATLNDASRSRSEFLSNMSHELRSPLTAILGFSEVLHDELYGPLNPKQKEHAGHIHQAGRHLLEVIDDILALSRIESGRATLDVGTCYPRQILEAAAGLLSQVATTHGVSLEWDVAPSAEVQIQADARKLKQALFNMGSRLARSAGPGGTLRMLAADDGEDHIMVDLIYRRSEAITRLVQGEVQPTRISSFGVSLALRMVELHGGTVGFEETPGTEGTFHVRIPREARPRVPVGSVASDEEVP